PVITPPASATSPTVGLVTSAATDNSANSGVAADQTDASRSVFAVPTATAETFGGVLLLIVVALAPRLRATNKPLPHVPPGPRLKPLRVAPVARQGSDSPEKARS